MLQGAEFDKLLKREVRRIVRRVQNSIRGVAGTDKRREYKRNWRRENALKHRAHTLLERVVASGKVIKPERCQRCAALTPKENLHGHHNDYTKPLAVEWLCPQCHANDHTSVTYA